MESLPKQSHLENNLLDEIHIKNNEIEETQHTNLIIIDPIVNYSLGLTYQAYGELEKAIEYFENPNLYENDNINVFTDLGIAYFTKGQIAKSYENFLKAIEKDPQDAIAYLGLGIIYNEKQNHNKALAMFHKAKVACPELEEDIDSLFCL